MIVTRIWDKVNFLPENPGDDASRMVRSQIVRGQELCVRALHTADVSGIVDNGIFRSVHNVQGSHTPDVEKGLSLTPGLARRTDASENMNP